MSTGKRAGIDWQMFNIAERVLTKHKMRGAQSHEMLKEFLVEVRKAKAHRAAELNA